MSSDIGVMLIFITWKNRRLCPEECLLQDQVLRGMVAMATDRNF
jgi:hypothetical protein